MKSKYKIFHFAGYILLAFIIYFAVDLKTLIDRLDMISLSATIALITVATLDRFTMAIKWMLLCSVLNMKTRYIQFLKIYYVATFLGYCLPSSIGGEVYKTTRLSQFEKSHDVLASIFMEKVVGIFSTVTFAWAGVLYITLNLDSENSITLFYILTGSTVGAIIVTWMSLHSVIQEKIITLFCRFRIGGYIEKLTTAYTSYKNYRQTLYWNYMLAIFETALQLSIMCGVGIALDINIPLPLLASIVAVTEFIRRIAIILDGWGFATALQIFIYGLAGINIEDALLIALLSHAVHFFASLPGGVIMFTDSWERR